MMKILLAEDNESIRNTIQSLLEMEGHACTPAVDGYDAKEVLEKDPRFDLLISDFRMPRWSGTELLDWCRREQIHFPVIFVTANSELLEKEKLALSDCCAALLRKPIGIDDLLQAIDAAKARNHARECAQKTQAGRESIP